MKNRPDVVKFVPAYWPGEELAFAAMSEAEASALIRQGVAVSINRGKAIRMKRKPVSLEVRGVSCKPNERLMGKYVEGVPMAIPAIECWRSAVLTVNA